MTRACIAVIDRSRARVYAYRSDVASPQDELCEIADLSNPTRAPQFTRFVVAELERIVRDSACEHVIVLASADMLAELRALGGVLHRANVMLEEIPHDLVDHPGAHRAVR
ncbi:MAG TPA: hypothetical protein VLX92_20045 [Kofleriaceae bacterium]|nr:hypothetical protein [Kofleriaceae bacterium]